MKVIQQMTAFPSLLEQVAVLLQFDDI